MQYERDDIYFCEGCCQFHDIKTDEVVEVPGVEYFNGIKVRPFKKKESKPKTSGFGWIGNNEK